MADDWVEVGWVRSHHESVRHADASRLLDLWLAERDLSRTSIADRDIRIDLVYLGPGNGCDVRVLVSQAAIDSARSGPPSSHPLIQHLADLESPWDADTTRAYDPVELVRHALSWPTEYWPGLALRWLEQGLPPRELADALNGFEAQSHRPQSQRHRARALRKTAGG